MGQKEKCRAESMVRAAQAVTSDRIPEDYIAKLNTEAFKVIPVEDASILLYKKDNSILTTVVAIV